MKLLTTMVFVVLALATNAAVPPEAGMLGVNLCGAEFGKSPGKFGTDYTYPDAESFDYFKAKGLTVVRLPFKWERIQRSLMGPLDEAELKRLDAVVAIARERGMKLMMDLHNYGKFGDAALGTAALPDAAFADVWRKLAEHYMNEPVVFAYGIMNEPVGAKDHWPVSAQAAVDAIRSVDTNHTISVCGGGFSGAHSWKKASNGFPLRDAASNLIYEAHQYFDRDNSGTYKQSFDDSGASPTTGVQRLRPFVTWLKENNARGFVGEFGVPCDDARWLEVLDNFIAEMKANGIGGTYWAAGKRWGKYTLSAEPRNGRDRPQMEVLAAYAGDRTKPKDAKVSYAGADAKMKASGQRQVFNFRAHDEAYHFANKDTEYASEVVEDAGLDARKISYRHKGNPAYIGLGLFYGALKCEKFSSFVLVVRSEKPMKLGVKAYTPEKATFSASFEVGTEWRELVIPFDQLKGDSGGFDAKRVLQKIEFQPSSDTSGNSLYLGEFKLAP